MDLINEYNCRHIFHGLSPNAETMANNLKNALKDLEINFIGHVNTTQFIHEFEIDMINRAIKLKKNKVFKTFFC